MSHEYPERQNDPQERLVLPASHENATPLSVNEPTAHMPKSLFGASKAKLGSEQLIRSNVQPGATNPFAKLVHLVRTDPAYQILAVAIVVLLLASGLLLAFVGSIFSPPRTTKGPDTGGGVVTLSHTATSTVKMTPTSQPSPTVQPSPTASPLPSPTPSPSPTASQTSTGPLTLTILNIPTSVSNNTNVPVVVKSSQPNISVHLVVTYNTAPGFYNSATATTGNNGNATLTWNVRVFLLTTNKATAHVQAVGMDQNGQQVQSASVAVTIR